MLWLIDIIVNQTMICQTTICCLGQRITVAPEGFKSKTKVQSMATVLLYFAKGLMPVVTPREAKPSSTSASVEMISFLKSCRFCPKVHIIYKIHHIASYCMLETNIAPPWLFEPRLLKIHSGWWHPFPRPQTNGGSGTSWGNSGMCWPVDPSKHPLNDTYCILVIIISI